MIQVESAERFSAADDLWPEASIAAACANVLDLYNIDILHVIAT